MPEQRALHQRALVIDEDDVLEALLRDVFAREGLTLEVVSSVEQALEILAREAGASDPGRPAFEVVLLEAPVGDKDGLALLEEITRLAPRSRVVVLCALSSREQVLAYLATGAAEVVLHGVDDLASLHERVRAAARADTSRPPLAVDPEALPAGLREAMAAIRAARREALPAV